MQPAATADRTHAASCSCLADADQWYADYAHTIRRYLLTRLRDPMAADECASEVFLRAIGSRHTFRCGGIGVRPWLFTIARNIAHDYNKKAWRRNETLVAVDVDGRDAAPTPEQLAIRQDVRTQLNHCIDQLPEDQGQCVRLRFIADLTVEQTARVMRRREGAIRALQYRAIRNLAKVLERNPQADPRAQVRPAA